MGRVIDVGIRENWHDRIIGEIAAKLQYLRNRVTVKIHKQSAPGADIVLTGRTVSRQINLEVQQFDSGSDWKVRTIPTWAERHDLVTIIVFPEPALERVISRIRQVPEYAFFKNPDVFLFSDRQIPEIIAFLGSLVLQNKL